MVVVCTGSGSDRAVVSIYTVYTQLLFSYFYFLLCSDPLEGADHFANLISPNQQCQSIEGNNFVIVDNSGMPKPKIFQVYLDWWEGGIWRVCSDAQAYHGGVRTQPSAESSGRVLVRGQEHKAPDAERDGSGQIIDVALNNLRILIITHYLHSPSSDSVNCYIASAFCQCTVSNHYLVYFIT